MWTLTIFLPTGIVWRLNVVCTWQQPAHPRNCTCAEVIMTWNNDPKIQEEYTANIKGMVAIQNDHHRYMRALALIECYSATCDDDETFRKLACVIAQLAQDPRLAEV
jgi:hypothetical protein